ncbi:phosphotransferase [Deinococcus sp.]|uniref:phosphotransferase n=1 Tax=Deinococcus sp. TaxID=47478 RepID=UPI0025D22EFF|nr:phosphotransferase [Deinococcus sp.]
MTAELQHLFDEPVLSMTVLSPGYSGHASDVWQVQTASGICIVRSPRPGAAQGNPFWWGLRELFGTDPQRLEDLQTINALLGRLGAFRVPQVKRVVSNPERSYAVLETVPGQMLDSFVGQGAELLTELGTGLARLHARKLDWWGHPSGRVRADLADFHPRLATVMQALVERFYVGTEIKVALPSVLAQLQQLPAPACACPLMIDLDPSQFLSEGGRLGALVDTEAFVMAPPEFDLIALDYLLDEPGADHFRHGYEQVRPLPPVTEVRTVYRFLYRLLEVQGDMDLGLWMKQPQLFP